MDFTKPYVLRDEMEYNTAIKALDDLLDADPSPMSEAYERFLSVLVQAYEDVHYSFDERVEPTEVVDFMLEQKGLSRSDLAQWMGGKSRVSEFFTGTRRLSIRQIEKLRTHLGIPADLLIHPLK